MTLLALLRHGDTDWSAEGRIQGRTDTPLSAIGRERLRQRALPPDWADRLTLSSPLARCVETATLLGVTTAKVDPRLVEMHWGAWEGQTLSELRKELGDSMRENEARGFDFRPEGGESPRQVMARVRPLLAETAFGGQPTLVIAHRGVIRVVYAFATGWDMLGKPPHKLDWDALQLFRLDSEGVPSVFRINVGLPTRVAQVGA